MYKSRPGQNKGEGYRAREDRGEHDGAKSELSRVETSTGCSSKDHSRVENNRALHSRPQRGTTQQNRGIVFWGNSSCHKLHCYLKAVSSGGETNAKPQKGMNKHTGVEMTSKEFTGTDNKALLP